MDCLYLILAGGPGRRLMPLTEDTPKPLLRFGTRGRVMDFTLGNILASNGGDALAAVNGHAEDIGRYLRVYWSGAFSSAGKNLAVVSPKDRDSLAFHGPAEAVHKALAGLHELPEFVAILPSDLVYKMDYRPLIDFHRDNDKALTVAAFPDDSGPETGHGILGVNKDGVVETMAISPPEGGDTAKRSGASAGNGKGPRLKSAGVYVFDTRELLERLAARAAFPELDLERSIVAEMVVDREVGAFLPETLERDGFIPPRDVDTVESFWSSQMDLLHSRDPSMKFTPLPGQGSMPFAKVELHDEVDNGSTRISKSALSDRAEIGAAIIENSIVAPGVSIEDGAIIKNSVVLDGARVREGVMLDGEVVAPMDDVRPDKPNVLAGAPRNPSA